MIAAAERILATRGDLQVVVPVAPMLDRDWLAAQFAGSKCAPRLVDGRACEAVGASDAAIVCSGTAALEAGLMQRPFVVVYRVTLLTELVFKLFSRIPHVSLVNLLAGRRLVPELLQREFTPERVAAEVGRWLDDEAAREELVRGLVAVRESLGPPGASARAAEAVVSLLRRIETQPAGALTVQVEPSPQVKP